MGCQSDVYIGDNLTFSITTHDPTTAILTDADAPPPYRIFEDETGVPILIGTMAILDDPNTTGFYTELIACTVANGFEPRRSYTIYITAEVGGDEGGIAYGFRALTPFYPMAGAIEFIYTVTDSGTGNPIPDMTVWVSTDAAGTNVIWSGITDMFGVALDIYGNHPWLDAGTFYFWKSKVGYVDDQYPDIEVVS